MKNVRIGLIGAGHLGRIHARLLSGMEGVEFVGVADPMPEARRAVASENNIAAGRRTVAETADFRELIPQIDAAIIATPTRFHHAVALELAERGIHLFVEKPITSTVAEARELVQAARWNNVVLQVGHIERFNPALAPLAARLAQPRYIEAVRQGPYSFRSTDISVVLDLMIHDLDIALWLSAERRGARGERRGSDDAGAASDAANTGGAVDNPVRDVAAVGWTVIGGEEDFAQARIEFADGCVANLTASRVSHRPRRQMQIWTADAHVEIDFNTRRSTIVEFAANESIAGQQSLAASPGERRFETLLPLVEMEAAPQNALLEEQRDFVECIRTGREPRVTGEAGLAALETAHRVLAQISARRGKQPQSKLPSTEPTAPAILRGPHWDHQPQAPSRRKEAG
ncbi:MAG TPA: Gfo/Idh/MocA family oxidoreductase [Pirellulales bacterium]|nr:Gfo/Idh/MocA family oxidoreductase [Pirellulales bacterium]